MIFAVKNFSPLICDCESNTRSVQYYDQRKTAKNKQIIRERLVDREIIWKMQP